MNVQTLDESWRIVLVVTPQSAHMLKQTLNAVQAKSFSSQISVLAADDLAVRNVLSELSLPVSYTLPRTIERWSYWTSVVSAYEFLGHRTLFLLTGTRVPEHWDARLVAAGQRAIDAVAIAPQCTRHPIFSAFSDPEHKPGLDVEEVDQWLNDYANGIEFTVPVMLESCMLLQGEYWRQTAHRFSDDQELFKTLREEGKFVLATDQVYVDDTQTAYSRDISFLPAAVITAYTRRHPLSNARHALTELSMRAEKPAELRQCLPVLMHVGHSWGGGLGRWIENYIDADTSHHHLVLRSIGDRTAFGQQICLYLGSEMRVSLRTWILAEPIQSIVTTQYEYRLLMQEIIRDFGVESVIISSLIGHSLDLLRSDVPVTYILHDFFPFCPALYATFDDPCVSCSPHELGNCAKSNPLNSYFKTELDQHWLHVRSAFLTLIEDHKIALVSPSQSVVKRYVTLEKSLRGKAIAVIEHGLPHQLVTTLTAARGAIQADIEGRLRIVVLGRTTREKGSALLADIIEELAQFADVWLLGAGEYGSQFRGLSNVTVVDEYSSMDMGAHLTAISPHLGLLLSIVPETFSYTLSELWAAGIPVLATRLGAFSDRIVDGKSGWLESLSAAHICKRLMQINEDRDSLARIRECIKQQSVRSATDMVKDYQLLKADQVGVPLRRYFLPRKTYQNPYRKPLQLAQKSVLFIDRQATYRAVLKEFLQYSAEKIDHTPRLSTIPKALIKRVVSAILAASSARKSKE